MSWINRFKSKWNVTSTFQFVIIMIVFACTGTTVVFIKKPLMSLVAENGDVPLWFNILYFILILPFYNILLLFYGFIFRQFDFFWNYEKKIIQRFRKNKETVSKS